MSCAPDGTEGNSDDGDDDPLELKTEYKTRPKTTSHKSGTTAFILFITLIACAPPFVFAPNLSGCLLSNYFVLSKRIHDDQSISSFKLINGHIVRLVDKVGDGFIWKAVKGCPYGLVARVLRQVFGFGPRIAVTRRQNFRQRVFRLHRIFRRASWRRADR